ncbi:hypothetical protein KC614_01565 [candidate division WWE3 bacterium]|uniref:Chlor_Arch_YYY domain-containing protein n=1 Tax=candidate division WWE3 bacterium TaxID=2053526 RepID=A0A955LK88_UNCKA|nr:hypothetical protein [candidate division WWE3 bacterium]
MMSDAQATLQFIVAIEVLGIAALPLANKLFRRLPDGGWAFAKIIGILLTGWLTWFLSSLHILAFSQLSISISLFIVTLFCWSTFARGETVASLKRAWLFIIVEETIFLIVMSVWTFVRGYSADIHGLEKFMDYGFMLSAMKTKYFPPLDHYLAGETINYYYFGHYLAGFTTKLARVPSDMGYNLQMSLIFALGSLEAFALAASVFWNANVTEKIRRLPWRSFIAGLIALLLINVFGNLHALIYYPGHVDTYWYPDATRFIEHTIHEFPIYSYIVNDLHGHVSDIPIVILGLAVVAIMILSFVKKKESNTKDTLRNLNLPLLLFLGFVIGTMYATNAWDFAIYLVVSGLALWTLNASSVRSDSIIKAYFSIATIVDTAMQSLILLLASVIPYIPFWLNLTPISQGIGLVPFGEQSPVWQVAILWGVQVPIAVLFIVWLYRRQTSSDKPFRSLVLKLAAKVFDLKVDIQKKLSGDTFEKELPSLNLGRLKIERVYVFLAIICVVSFLLILLPEVIYIRDIYPTYYRANTMFKFYYQAWIMLGIVCGVSIIKITQELNRRKSWWRFPYVGVVLFLVVAAGMYPIEAIDQGFGNFKGKRQSIAGTEYLSRFYPSDSQAIDWINANIDGQPVFAEAVGESYTDYAMVSANTGVPTVMGWPVHEWLWRGSYSEPMKPETHVQQETGQVDTVGGRVEDMRQFYETTDVNLAQSLIDKYHIEYVYVGSLEREKYNNLNTDKFLNMRLEIVYDKDNVQIYKAANN